MQKYKVKVQGEHIIITIVGESGPKSHGFFTYRVIYADDVSEVKSKATQLINSQLSDLAENDEHNPPIINILQIEEMMPGDDDSFKDMGFAFYSEEFEDLDNEELSWH